MQFQLLGDWPIVRGLTIPAATILSGLPPVWNGITLTLPLPINVIALDNAAATQMLTWYNGTFFIGSPATYVADQRYRLIFGPAVTIPHP
jgi:hypothetical protein